MNVSLTIGESSYSADLSSPLDISIPISENGPRAWYVEPPTFSPVMENGFVGSVAQGGAVNFRNIHFNPHGHGTHTECLGHISKTVESVNEAMSSFFHLCSVISIEPSHINGDSVITRAQLEASKIDSSAKAIAIRTLPNPDSKKQQVYSSQNPPFIHKEAIEYLVELGIEHLLLDVPSVDKEVDGGVLAGHHAFWKYPENPRTNCTITEFIYIDNNIHDGLYLLDLQVAAFENDAAPSRPVLYAIRKQPSHETR